MEPCNFSESNITLGPPKGYTEDEVKSVRAWKGGEKEESLIVTCWKPTQKELNRIQQTGRLWLWVHADWHPPVNISSYGPFDDLKEPPAKPFTCAEGHPTECIQDNSCKWCDLITAAKVLVVAVSSGKLQPTADALDALCDELKTQTLA